MAGEVVHIEELQLRVPGVSAEEARRIGEEAAQRVAGGLQVHGRVEHLGALDLRVSIPHGTSREQLVQLVADKILLRLK